MADAVWRFPFEFEARYALLLRALGVCPDTSEVVVTPERFIARFGRWVIDTPLANLSCARLTGPYRAYRAIGARGSFADGGATFGTTTSGGVCVEFREPVRGLEPLAVARHRGLTVTVADPSGLLGLLRRLGVGQPG